VWRSESILEPPNSGSFATLTAIRHASSRGGRLTSLTPVLFGEWKSRKRRRLKRVRSVSEQDLDEHQERDFARWRPSQQSRRLTPSTDHNGDRDYRGQPQLSGSLVQYNVMTRRSVTGAARSSASSGTSNVRISSSSSARPFVSLSIASIPPRMERQPQGRPVSYSIDQGGGKRRAAV
jgi:hypothetical protein